MATPDLSIIIVSFNGKDDLLICLKSLDLVRSELNVEVIVVDNGSTDDSPAAIREAFAWVRVIEAGKNLGFAAGCNRGLAEKHGRHVMLLNPDTEVMPQALTCLVQFLDLHPECGAAGPQMIDQNDRLYRSARRFPSPSFLFCECTRLIHFFPRSKLFGAYFYGDREISDIERVDQVEGSALVVSESALKAVGPLDERFFLFFEEVDWCRRIRSAGFEIRVVRDAKIRHHRATTMSRFYVESRRANAESALKYFNKHHGQIGVRSLRRWMKAALLIRIAATSLIGLFGKKDLAQLRLKGAREEYQVYRHFTEI